MLNLNWIIIVILIFFNFNSSNLSKFTSKKSICFNVVFFRWCQILISEKSWYKKCDPPTTDLLYLARYYYLTLFRTISCPLDGRLSRTQAIILCAFTWVWAMPFTILPLIKVWGRFVPGKQTHTYSNCVFSPHNLIFWKS